MDEWAGGSVLLDWALFHMDEIFHRSGLSGEELIQEVREQVEWYVEAYLLIFIARTKGPEKVLAVEEALHSGDLEGAEEALWRDDAEEVE